MSAQKITIKGVYSLPASEGFVAEALIMKYGDVKLTPEQEMNARKAIEEELSRVILVDLEVKNAVEDFNLAGIPQGSGQEEPYLPMYLTLDGVTAISRQKPVNENNLRMSFYLHDYQSGDSLKMAEGEVSLPVAKSMATAVYQVNPYRPRTKITPMMLASVGIPNNQVAVWEGSGFWIRALAYVIDLILFFAVSYCVEMIITVLYILLGHVDEASYDAALRHTTVIRYVLSIIPWVAYFIICESVFGATLGKLICKLRVVKLDGSLVSFWQAFLRGIFRLVDGLFFGGVAALFMSAHRNQRIGDQIAKSYVVPSKDIRTGNQRPVGYLVLALLASIVLIFLQNMVQLVLIIREVAKWQ